jgi:hypothetical protein
MRLGGPAGTAEDFPEKPKGMHHKTYWQLIREYEYCAGPILAAMAV